jgi:hypothetical protein
MRSSNTLGVLDSARKCRARTVKSSDDPNKSRLGLMLECGLYDIDHPSRESARAARRGPPKHATADKSEAVED